MFTCLWLQLCIGSHSHVCDLGLSADAVYLWVLQMITILCAVLVTVYYCTVLYCSYGTSCGSHSHVV